MPYKLKQDLSTTTKLIERIPGPLIDFRQLVVAFNFLLVSTQAQASERAIATSWSSSFLIHVDIFDSFQTPKTLGMTLYNLPFDDDDDDDGLLEFVVKKQ